MPVRRRGAKHEKEACGLRRGLLVTSEGTPRVKTVVGGRTVKLPMNLTGYCNFSTGFRGGAGGRESYPQAGACARSA